MPNIGEIRKGTESGYKYKGKHVWHACIDCGKERWVLLQNGVPRSQRCLKCAPKVSQLIREQNPMWKGGRYKMPSGYIVVRISPDDFFAPMADKKGRIFEHRLVMAKHLGRCLHKWEEVHHKGLRYIGAENKSDNSLDNLKLSCHIGEHISNHIKGYHDGYLKGLYDGHEARIKQLEARITLIEAENVLLKQEVAHGSLQ